ncbi:hypothetical protein ABFA07_009852 [Porites harrisoni]
MASYEPVSNEYGHTDSSRDKPQTGKDHSLQFPRYMFLDGVDEYSVAVECERCQRISYYHQGNNLDGIVNAPDIVDDNILVSFFILPDNNIPVFSPAITDGALGDTLYFHSYKNPGLVIDIVEDVKRINNISVFAKNTGMIILGGGLIKHHICNASLMRNGADFSVFVNTGQEFDGSDSGARPDQAVSWGKIKMTATPVKVYADASLVFPLLVAETFARNFKLDN